MIRCIMVFRVPFPATLWFKIQLYTVNSIKVGNWTGIVKSLAKAKFQQIGYVCPTWTLNDRMILPIQIIVNTFVL